MQNAVPNVYRSPSQNNILKPCFIEIPSSLYPYTHITMTKSQSSKHAEMTPHKDFSDSGWVSTKTATPTKTKIEEDPLQKKKKEAIKSLGLVAVLVVLWAFSKVIGDQVTKTRADLAKVPLFWFVVLVCTTQVSCYELRANC